MPSSKSNPGWRRSWLVGVLGISLLVVVLVVIWFAWPASAPSSGSTGTAAGKPSVEKADAKNLREEHAKAGGDARNASWISFERVLLLAAVVANYLLLAVVAWSYWRARQPNLDVDLAQRLQALGVRLDAVEHALRAGLPKPTTSPLPATPDPVPRAKSYEPPREPASRPASRPAPEPVQLAPVFQEPPSPPARKRPVDESRRSPESRAWTLVNQYCQMRGSSILDLGQNARALGLQVGSPGGISGRRHVLNGPDSDIRLLAIKDGYEEKLFVVVGADAAVTESDWLDLFKRRSFPGVSPVRSTRPATVNAVSGEIEDMGELEVLGPP